MDIPNKKRAPALIGQLRIFSARDCLQMIRVNTERERAYMVYI